MFVYCAAKNINNNNNKISIEHLKPHQLFDVLKSNIWLKANSKSTTAFAISVWWCEITQRWKWEVSLLASLVTFHIWCASRCVSFGSMSVARLSSLICDPKKLFHVTGWMKRHNFSSGISIIWFTADTACLNIKPYNKQISSGSANNNRH